MPFVATYNLLCTFDPFRVARHTRSVIPVAWCLAGPPLLRYPFSGCERLAADTASFYSDARAYAQVEEPQITMAHLYNTYPALQDHVQWQFIDTDSDRQNPAEMSWAIRQYCLIAAYLCCSKAVWKH
eukprot:3100633-Pleurochrysis_carterae.AAC.1